jgi:type II/III secretion system protein
VKILKRQFMIAIFALCGIVITGYSQEKESLKGVLKTTEQIAIDATNLKNREAVVNGTTRKITLLEDRDQNYMTTKVYEIKHMKAVDLRPFVEGAVRRADRESTVARLNYKFGKQQFLSVSMPIFMVPYIDDMIKKLDRGGVKDDAGSVIAGTGIHHFYYKPNIRSTLHMLEAVIRDRFQGGDEAIFRDPQSNLFYWKGSASDGKDIAKWLKALDRPLPQMQVRVKIYQISEDDLIELGIDWVALKNGPGAELFGIGLDFLDFQSFSDISSLSNMLDVSSLASFTSPGIFVAPNIDMTFLRLLNQKGKARVATSTYLTIVNDQNRATDRFGNSSTPGAFGTARYRIRFNPVFQAITKDNNEIAVETTQPGITLYFCRPVIGHNNTKNPTEAAMLNFGWNLEVDNAMSEQTNTGDRIEDDYQFESHTTIGANSEKLLATYIKHHKVSQDNGVPFLGEIPGLKYIFGSSADSMKKYRYYITLEAKAVLPGRSWGHWAGQIVTAGDMLKKYADSNETAVLPPENNDIQIPYLYRKR